MDELNNPFDPRTPADNNNNNNNNLPAQSTSNFATNPFGSQGTSVYPSHPTMPAFDRDMPVRWNMPMHIRDLDLTMRPENVYINAEMNQVTLFPERTVLHTIKSIATSVYYHQTMTYGWQDRVSNGKNSLSYFICAMYSKVYHKDVRLQPFDDTLSWMQRQLLIKPGWLLSESNPDRAPQAALNEGDIQFGNAGDASGMSGHTMLPLGYWDGIYYALSAEIRELHALLKARFAAGYQFTQEIYHHGGEEAGINWPMRAIDISRILESSWTHLNDPRLIATLDKAVRTRMYFNRRHVAPEFTRPFTLVNDKGLLDINRMTTAQISVMLWTKRAQDMNEKRQRQARVLARGQQEASVPTSCSVATFIPTLAPPAPIYGPVHHGFAMPFPAFPEGMELPEPVTED